MLWAFCALTVFAGLMPPAYAADPKPSTPASSATKSAAPDTPADDDEFLEFLGSVDAEGADEDWLDYLARIDIEKGDAKAPKRRPEIEAKK